MRRGTSIVIVLDQAVVGHVDDDALGPVEGRLAVHEQLLSWLAEAAIEDRERRLHLEPRRDSALLTAYGDRPDPQAQISASVGTRLCVITLPIRETFIKCL